MTQPVALFRWCCVTGLVLAFGVVVSAAARQAPACSGVADCRAQTEAAIAERDYERAHDLGWRTVQQGPRNDRGLMFLLARTQALSGRPDDALVMIRRIAEAGTAVDVSADEFLRMRELPGWPGVEAVIAGRAATAVPAPPAPATASAVAPRAPKAPLAPLAPAPTPTPEAPKASASVRGDASELRRDRAVAVPGREGGPEAPKAPAVPTAIEDAGHFTSSAFAPGGLACDAVSKRFVFGDRPGRKLLIVAEGSDHSIDLTRADLGGFLDVMALDIDTTNGTLWVASAAADGTGATLHRLQLISGRALASYGMPHGDAAVQPVDVAVTAARGVLVLDAAQRRVLVLRAGSNAVEVFAPLGDHEPTTLAVGRQDALAYVAHRDGLLAIDLRTRKVTALMGPKGATLAGIERLRRDGAGLVGVQALPDGSRRLVRLTLSATGAGVTRLRVLDVPLPAGSAPIFAAVCGDSLGFLVGERLAADESSMSWTLRRVRLGR